VFHGLPGIHGAAPRGDAGVLAIEREDHPGFHLFEGLDALRIKDLPQELVIFLLEQQVGIHEAQAQRLGQKHAHRAFAAGGHAYEGDVGSIRHAVTSYT